MAKYLITGIAGFIGSSLAAALVTRGDKVPEVDNFLTGKRENLRELLHHIEFREADLCDAQAMHEACEGVDYILHHGARLSSALAGGTGTQSPLQLEGTFNVLEAAPAAHVKRFIYAASSSAYGDPSL